MKENLITRLQQYASPYWEPGGVSCTGTVQHRDGRILFRETSRAGSTFNCDYSNNQEGREDLNIRRDTLRTPPFSGGIFLSFLPQSCLLRTVTKNRW